MNERERFAAVADFEEPDYVPIFAFGGAPGMSGGCMKKTHHRLVETGMPAHVRGVWRLDEGIEGVESWRRYWGTSGPIGPGFSMAWGEEGFKRSRRIENGFEIIESESGAVVRQVIDNNITYSMPDFIRFAVRDRESWEFYKERNMPRVFISPEEMEARARELDERDRPLAVSGGGVYGFLRGLFGPEGLSLMLYDDPELIHEITAWRLARLRHYSFPLIERLKPEIVVWGEDLCYNHGMLLSPRHFHEFCGPIYREQCECARENGAHMISVDTDGSIMEFTGIAEPYGVNCLHPCEVKAGNDLFKLREQHPRFIFMGWLEKECINEGNGHMIEPEIMGKVPAMRKLGGYFPNGDHGIQPLATFGNLCKFMTILHEECGNPEGEFPRTTRGL